VVSHTRGGGMLAADACDPAGGTGEWLKED
jgi:hypothetical protein